MTWDVDAVVAGGGVAGSSTAAALAALGWSVLIVEPGQHDDRRLSGELIHPAGVAGLARLGLLSSAFAAAARLAGFVVLPDAEAPGGVHLPYRNGQAALALDHAAICRSMLADVAALPRVSLARGWRVAGMADIAGGAVVQMRRGTTTEAVSCRLLVAADGASSPVRCHAGLRHRRTRTALLTGYLVDPAALPVAGYGHVFSAAGGPVLAYAIGPDRARVLLNRALPRHGSHGEPATLPACLPPRLRAEVEAASAAGAVQRFVSSDVAVTGVARGRVVLVGDAAGTCHPISASGMTMGIDDAIRLGQALRDRDGDIAASLARYAAQRRPRQRARVLLAALLHEVLGGAAAEMGMLRAGMHRYWSGNARARTASMALLAMDDPSVRSILLEVLRVAACGFVASCGEPATLLHRSLLTVRLSRHVTRHLIGALRVQ
ncbi:MAG: FAD-dependent monooxygenase [Acetobacteraceae bacterium]